MKLECIFNKITMLQAYIFFDGKVSKTKSARFLPAYSTNICAYKLLFNTHKKKNLMKINVQIPACRMKYISSGIWYLNTIPTFIRKHAKILIDAWKSFSLPNPLLIHILHAYTYYINATKTSLYRGLFFSLFHHL